MRLTTGDGRLDIAEEAATPRDAGRMIEGSCLERRGYAGFGGSLNEMNKTARYDLGTGMWTATADTPPVEGIGRAGMAAECCKANAPTAASYRSTAG